MDKRRGASGHRTCRPVTDSPDRAVPSVLPFGNVEVRGLVAGASHVWPPSIKRRLAIAGTCAFGRGLPRGLGFCPPDAADPYSPKPTVWPNTAIPRHSNRDTTHEQSTGTARNQADGRAEEADSFRNHSRLAGTCLTTLSGHRPRHPGCERSPPQSPYASVVDALRAERPGNDHG